MTTLDIIILIIIAVGAFLGWRAGLIRQIGRLAAFVLAIIACRLFGPWAGEKLGIAWLGYPVVGLVVYTVVAFLARGLKQMFKAVKLGKLDSIAGAAFNLVEWGVAASLLLNIWVNVYPDSGVFDDSNSTLLDERILAFAPAVIGSEPVKKVYDAATKWVPGQAHDIEHQNDIDNINDD